MASVVPPGVKGTMMLMGLAGQPCAITALLLPTKAATPRTFMRSEDSWVNCRVNVIMLVS